MLPAQGDGLSVLGQTLASRADKSVPAVQADYLPGARRTAETTGNVLKAAAGAARQEFDKGQGDIKSAALTPVPKKKGRTGKVLLIVGLAAAGAAAGYIVWQIGRASCRECMQWTLHQG